MTDDARLAAFLSEVICHDRVCPVPIRWDELWTRLGRPSAIGGPLILSGWAFSTDREKRARFFDHIRFAFSAGRAVELEVFLGGLAAHEWHECPEHALDRSYGRALIDDVQRWTRSTSKAAALIRSGYAALAGRSAYSKTELAETVFLYHLLFDEPLQASGEDPGARKLRPNIDPENLPEGVPDAIRGELERIRDTGCHESLLTELLVCIREADMPFDRDSIADFVADVFEEVERAS
jgi:hypothetical protein